MINGQARVSEEGVNRITVAGIDRDRLHCAATPVRPGGEPTAISPGDHDP